MGTESIIALIAVCLLFLYIILEARNTFTKRSRFYPIPFILMIIGILFLILVLYRGTELVARDWAQILLTIGLLTITAVYAWSTQKMAKEMRAQRYDTVRPVIDICRDPTDEDKVSEAIAANKKDPSRGLSCVLHNIGLGPAIDLYSFIQTSSGSQRYDFGTLAKGGKTFRKKLSTRQEGRPSDLLLVAYYSDIYGRECVSSRIVSIDTEKGWVLEHLHTPPPFYPF